MKKIKYLGYSLVLLLLSMACEQDTMELQEPEPDLTNVVDEPCPPGATAGSADFSKFVTIGNSLTAGYQAGALFTEGQENSLSKILATQFECVGGSTTFNQPDINSELGFNTVIDPNPAEGVVLGRLLLQGTPPTPTPTISDATSVPSPNPPFMYTGSSNAVAVNELNNFGVPGIRLGQLEDENTGNWALAEAENSPFNPYYARFASAPASSTILEDAISSLENGGTFFSFWLGNNDVLGYATSGATNLIILTATTDFEEDYNNAIDKLLAVPNIKGVVGNIPNVTTIPYFTTVTWDVIAFDEAEEADVASVNALNAGFAGFNAALDGIVAFGHNAEDAARRKVVYSYGNNPVLIFDEDLEDLGPKFDMLQGEGAITPEQRAALAPYEQARPITAGELITLSAGAVLGTLANPANPATVIGAAVPLGDEYTLTTTELAVIQERINAFNTIIADKVAASDNRIALADVNAKFTQLATTGFDIVNGVTITPTLAPPTGGFSEDGVHPNTRGYAYLANIFIDAINAKFGATIPKVNLSKYKGTALPVNP